MFEFDKFTGECSFCYKHIKDVDQLAMYFCECRTETCFTHNALHIQLDHPSVLVLLIQDNPLDISVEDFGFGIDKEAAAKIVKDALTFRDFINVEKEKKKCEHIEKSEKNSIKKIKLKQEKCIDCEIDSNTWGCIKCGEVFCGRKQYGIEGNGHAKKHFEEKKHSVYVKIQSIDREKNMCECFCYMCDDMIDSSGILSNLVLPEKNYSGEQKQMKGITMNEIERQINTAEVCAEETNAEKESAMKEKKEYGYRIVNKEGGIYNMGNTCYISSVLHSIVYAVGEKIEKFFDLSEKRLCYCPALCFGCQLEKVLHRIDISHKKDGGTFSIASLWKVIEQTYPKYSIGAQQDATEFYEDIMCLIYEYTRMKHFSGAYDLFLMEVVIETVCEGCKSKKEQREERNLIYLQKGMSISKYLNSEEVLEIKCNCGMSTKKQRTYLSRASDVLVCRHMSQQEIEKSVDGAEECKIEKVEYDKAGEIEKDFLVEVNGEKKKYSLVSVVLHEGSCMAGHYFSQGRDGMAAGLSKDEINKLEEFGEVKHTDCTDCRMWTVHDDKVIGAEPLMERYAVLLFYRRE